MALAKQNLANLSIWNHFEKLYLTFYREKNYTNKADISVNFKTKILNF